MAAMRRWDPFRELVGIQNELNRLFGRTFGGELSDTESAGGWTPPMDVHESPEGFTVTLELPGMTTGDVDITVEDNVLTVSGERKFYEGVNEDAFHRIERRYGRFVRRIVLPQQCDPEKVEASMHEGILNISVPKAEQAKPRRIEVKATS